MILDKTLTFSAEQAVTATANSTNSVQIGGDEIAKTMNLCAQVTVDFATLTSLALEVYTCATDSATANDWTKILALPTVAVADLTAGARPWGFVKLPYGCKKFVRVKYVVTGSNATAGKIDAFLTPSAEVE